MKKIYFLIFLFLISSEVCLAGTSVLGPLTHLKAAHPGEKYEGVILLRNSEETPSEVKVYQTDYLFYADGKNIYGESGSVPRSNATWISVSPNRLTIPPREEFSVHYTVQVPSGQDMKGTYWSMIMVEPISETSAESAKWEKDKSKVAISTVIRYGIQMITEIGNAGASQIKFADKKIISEDGNRVLQLDIENTGERVLSPAVWVELYNKEGASVGRFESGKVRIYPGCSVRHRILLPKVAGGNYRALVVADNGDESIFGAQYDLEME